MSDAAVSASEYVGHDAVGLAGLVAGGEVTPAELEAAAFRAARAVDGCVNALAETWPVSGADGTEGSDGADGVDGVARASSAGAPLAGVPFLIKDIGVAMAGRRSELGSRLAAGHVSRSDSFLMRRFRRAGLMTFGRTTTPELANSITSESVLHGVTRNPWDLARDAGGSSAGAGAAVASGIVPAAHATDAAGSLRVPAAHNGLFGLKPSRGRISMGPGADEVLSGFAVQGAVSRTVRDSAVLLDLTRGREPGDPYTAPEPSRPYAEEVGRPPGTLRIGVVAEGERWGGRRTAAPVADALARTVRLLESLGHRVEEAEAELGVGHEEFTLAVARLSTANLTALVDALAAASGRPVDSTTLEPPTLAAHRYGARVSGAEFADALGVRNRVARSLAASAAPYDVLLTPTLPGLPPPSGAYTEGGEALDGLGWIQRLVERAPFTLPFNVAGTPAMSVPLAADPTTGLPLGMQFAAGYGREDLLFRLAGQLEEASPWRDRVPAVWAGTAAAPGA